MLRKMGICKHTFHGRGKNMPFKELYVNKFLSLHAGVQGTRARIDPVLTYDGCIHHNAFKIAFKVSIFNEIPSQRSLQ